VNPEITEAVTSKDLIASSVLSGNRNFEGRIHPLTKLNFLASPPLVVAYALAGSVMINLEKEPIGVSNEGHPVYLKDIWPSQREIQDLINQTINPKMFNQAYQNALDGDSDWQELKTPKGEMFEWEQDSTYIKKPPYFESMNKEVPTINDITQASVLALLGDSVTTDHISPAGSIDPSSPAGQYLLEQGVTRRDFNSYGSRRGNHEVMMRALLPTSDSEIT
jgi:aconitate hydratase